MSSDDGFSGEDGRSPPNQSSKTPLLPSPSNGGGGGAAGLRSDARPIAGSSGSSSSGLVSDPYMTQTESSSSPHHHHHHHQLSEPSDRKRRELDAAAHTQALDSAKSNASDFEIVGDSKHVKHELMDGPASFGVNSLFFSRLKVLMQIGCCGGRGRSCALSPIVIKVIGIVLVSIIVAIAQVVVINPLLGTFTQAIVDKDGATILHAVIVASIAIVILSVGTVSIQYLGQRVCLDWRANLTNHFQDVLFNNSLLYQIVSIQRRIDNTDQRVASAIADFTLGMGGVFVGNFDSTPGGLLLPFFLLVASLFSLFQYGWLPATMMVIWAVINLAVAIKLAQRVSQLVFQQDKYEGDLRVTHNLVRTFNESIAFYGGEPQECKNARNRFAAVYSNYRRLIKWEFALASFNNFSNAVMSSGIGYIAIILLNIALHHSYGGIADVTDVALATQSGLQALLAVPVVISMLGPIAGNCHRLGELLEVCDQTIRRLAQQQSANAQATAVVTAAASAGGEAPVRQSVASRGVYVDGDSVKLERVSLATPPVVDTTTTTSTASAGPFLEAEPEPVIMYRDITFDLPKGSSLLIMGPSGSGKTSLLRVIGNLWPLPGGTITRPEKLGRGGIFFVPQRPYLTRGTLRQQLIYPHSTSESTDTELIALLHSLELDFLFKSWGLDSVVDWSDVLSGGESQRLGFARMLYHHPIVAVMDESTSALDVPLEAKCFRLCRARGISMLSVAHRPTAIPFHDYIIRLKRASSAVVTSSSPSHGGSGGAGLSSRASSVGSWSIEPVTNEMREVIEQELSLFGVSQTSVNDSKSPAESPRAGAVHSSAKGQTTSTFGSDDQKDLTPTASAAAAASSDVMNIRATTARPDTPHNSVEALAKAAEVTHNADSFEDWYNKRNGATGNKSKDSKQNQTESRVNMVFWRRLWHLIRIGFPEWHCLPARYAYGCLALLIAAAYLTMYLVQLSSQLFAAEANNNSDDSVRYCILWFVLATLATVANTVAMWIGQIVCLHWRQALMKRAEDLYFRDRIAYVVNSLDRRLDNIGMLGRVCLLSCGISTKSIVLIHSCFWSLYRSVFVC